MQQRAHVLVIDNDVTSIEALRVGLVNNGLVVEVHADPREAFQALAATPFDVIIAAAEVAPVNGRGILKRVHRQDPAVPVIVLVDRGSAAAGAEAVKRGAYDYIEKPFEAARVRALVERALEVRRLRIEVEQLRADMRAGAGGGEMIAQSPAMRSALEAVRRASAGDSCVLVEGDPGTGKRLMARTIHQMSARAGKPFLAADAAALGAGLLESELFGHVRGAFAGATADYDGLFEAASGGTVFLDAVNELSKAAQQRLLGVIETGKVRPLGAAKARQADVRLVVASCEALDGAVRDHRFRSGLYERLSAVVIALPPLAERREDIPLLAHYFVKKVCADMGVEPPAIPAAVIERLLAHPWPGNVRQLRDTMTRAALQARGGALRLEDLEDPVAENTPDEDG